MNASGSRDLKIRLADGTNHPSKFESAFYHTDVPDWEASYAQVNVHADQSTVCMDTGNHAPDTTIDFVIAQLLRIYPDVRPGLATWRESRGLPANPMTAFNESGYLKQVADTRVGGSQSGWGA